MRYPLRFILFLFFLQFLSCTPEPNEVKKMLVASGDNKKEFDKIIQKYSWWDNEKLNGVYFLLANMDKKYSYGGEDVDNFDAMFRILDSLRQKKVYIKTISPIVQSKWDSLANIYGNPSPLTADEYLDMDSIKANFLIEDIELAFKIRKEIPVAAQLSPAQFYEYILPYRIGNEKLENWRVNLYKKYSGLRDSLKHDGFKLATAIYEDIHKSFKSNHAIAAYPFDVCASKMQMAHCGTCRSIAIYTTMALRANGIPAVIDFTPFWGNRSSGHEWVSVLRNKSFVSLEEKSPYRLSKVFRMTYEKQKGMPLGKVDLPPSMIDPYRKDVTNEYVKTHDVKVPLKDLSLKKKIALICTYSKNSWKPQDYGEVKANIATFKNIGAEILYLAMYYDKGNLIPASDPFILEKDGTIRKIITNRSQQQSLNLNRKFPCFPSTVKLMRKMVSCRFQGANKPDFSDSVNLYTVKDIPEKIELARINNSAKFRYVRYISNKKDGANLAEMKIFGDVEQKELSGKIIGFPKKSKDKPNSLFFSYDKVFDGDYDTFFETGGTNVGWVGLDLGKPTKITAIKYAPQSDSNFIIPGDIYELYYWDWDKWEKIGTSIGREEYIRIGTAPSNGLYILRDISRGNEERIFTYEQGMQIWW